jgi:hypothetical protein
MCVVGTFQRAEIIIVSTDQVCRHGKPFEVLGSQRRFLVGP